MNQINKSDLSVPHQKLVELMQSINFGSISNFLVTDGYPHFTLETVIEREIRLSAPKETRPELAKDDFVLKQEIMHLFDAFERIKNGSVCLLEIKHGLPFLVRMAEQAI